MEFTYIKRLELINYAIRDFPTRIFACHIVRHFFSGQNYLGGLEIGINLSFIHVWNTTIQDTELRFGAQEYNATIEALTSASRTSSIRAS